MDEVERFEESLAPAAPLALTHGLVDTDSAKALAAVDQRIAFYNEIRKRTVKLTLPQDWVDMGGKPYLQGQGVQRLKQPWGLYFRDVRIEPTLEETRTRLRRGEHVSVEVIGMAGSRVTGEESVFLGGRSSDDGFFADRKGGIEQLDAEDLRKAAITNWEVRAGTDLLGLRGLTWADLERFGFKRGEGGTVSYRQSGESTGATSRKPIVNEIKSGLEIAFGPKALDALKTLTTFKSEKDGKMVSMSSWEALDKASDKWLYRILADVKKEVAAWQQTQEAAKAEPQPKLV